MTEKRKRSDQQTITDYGRYACVCGVCSSSYCQHGRTDSGQSRRVTKLQPQSVQPDLVEDHHSSRLYRSVATHTCCTRQMQ